MSADLTNLDSLASLGAEPSVIRALSADQKQRLTEVLDRYLVSLESGAPISREELLSADADLAGPLAVYLDSLAELHDAAAGFRSASAQADEPSADEAKDEKRIGDYRIIREVGRGGMGVVYEATQISLARRVALKILPFAAVLDSKQIARFKNEAQAAAQLHHPNIVPVYAVGVERGVHYYAMMFIDGQPLDVALDELRKTLFGAEPRPDDAVSRTPDETVVYLDANASTSTIPTNKLPPRGESTAASTQGRSLLTQHSTHPRDYYQLVVRLGIQAAEGLHAAHEFGVVHRDIKPSNLLLDADSKVWITDFGLARCQTDASLTRTGDLVGTVRYMSPEQASGNSALVDGRTDVYSLGATLYELLALQPAFAGDDGAALLRRIDQEEPARLRKLRPDIPIDLETVVAKAMAKQPAERYLSAKAFADDLRRVLEGKPTVARRATVPERIAKWGRRHSQLVMWASGVSLVMVVGLAAAALLIAQQKVAADENAARADANYREARRTVDQLGAGFADRLADIPGAERVRGALLRETLNYYDLFVEQAKNDPTLRADLALTFSKIGSLTEQIDSLAEALAAHRHAAELFEQLAADEPHEAEHRRRLAVAHNDIGWVQGRSGMVDEARAEYARAIDLIGALLVGSPHDAEYRADLAKFYGNLGLLEEEAGNDRGAEKAFADSLRLGQVLVDESPDDVERLQILSTAYINVSSLDMRQHPERAASTIEKAIEYLSKLAIIRPDDLKIQSGLAASHNNLASVQARLGQNAATADSYGKAIDIQEKLVAAAPAQKAYRCALAKTYNNRGIVETELGNLANAEKSFAKALDMQEPLVRQYPREAELCSILGGIFNNAGSVLEKLHRTKDAAVAYQKAIDHQRAALSLAPKNDRYRDFLSKHYYNYGKSQLQLGRVDLAIGAACDRGRLWQKDAARLLTVADELGWCHQKLVDSRASAAAKEECAAMVLAILRQARDAGWHAAAGWERQPAFASLSQEAQFIAFVKQTTLKPTTFKQSL